MIIEIIALCCAIATIYLRLRWDREAIRQDLTNVILLRYFLTPWSKRRWIWKVWVFNFVCWYYVYCAHRQRKRERTAVEVTTRKLENAAQHGLYRSIWDYNDASSPLKPVIFPCRTSHTRLFPKKHSFSYSYLFVGIPVGWRGYISTILSADLKGLPWRQGLPRKGWFDVDSGDYLARGENLHGLRGKLDDYLESQDESIEDYPYAYLVTAPRFLGYSFNPVSFWYLYDNQKKLKAMILEVNNTFDERRMYYLKDTATGGSSQGADENSAQESPVPDNPDEEKSPSLRKAPGDFKAAWSKDFHVSPFNSRRGGYSLSATDPFVNHLVNGNLKASCGQVNNTITLGSSKGHPKLIARVFSTSDSVDPYSFDERQTLRFVRSWCWVGFVTFPRIVREAGKLFFRRRLHVWYRPEVLKDSIGRNETGDEKAIAFLFRDYFKSHVEDSDLPIPVQFISGIPAMPSSETFTPRTLSPSKTTRQPTPDQTTPLTFKPTTPLFYALIARQSDLHTLLKSSLTNPDPKTATFHTCNPNLFLQLFENPYSSSANQRTSSSIIESTRWSLIHFLRAQPSRSPLDVFAVRLNHVDKAKARAYRIATLKVLVSDYLAFGSPAVIDAVLWLVRLWLCWVYAESFMGLLAVVMGNGSSSPLETGRLFLGCVGVHLWAGVGALL